MSRKLLVILIGAVAVIAAAVMVVVLLVIPQAQPEPDPVAATVPVGLPSLPVPKDTKIGVIITAGAGTAEGSEWRAAAEGARVAQQRFDLGGTKFSLVTEDDRGTSEGGAEAVAALTEQKVAGIVLASSGKHLEGALAAAAKAGIPVILPYSQAPKDAKLAWSLDATESNTAEAMNGALSEFRHPLLLDLGTDLPADVKVGDRVTYKAGTDLGPFVSDVVHLTGTDALAGGAYGGGEHEDDPKVVPVEDPADALVVSGHPTRQAAIAAALQQRGVTVPVVLTPSAVSPTFAETLVQQGGSVTPQLLTVGAPWNDTVALNADAQGRTMSAFLAATRQFAGDESVKNLLEDAPFAEVAPDAEVRSHDAVVAFVEAISQAQSVEPGEVESELRGLTLNSGNGIAGPDLDFSTPEACKGSVGVLRATDQYLGLRIQPEENTEQLVWFAEPSLDGSPLGGE